ncbi:putative CREB-binding protein, immediate-early protein [White spot syndrome virus]|uniref:Wsv100 n=3 Tax=White spot syndrome virus TaxID=342409 RepID=A0A0A0Y4D6_WSSVS|nr:wsv100 [Shrimp white spot syndrome virus]YP_009220504.1 putative CREB-binding protein, immediate-early protein [White spot syndrome virus]AYW76525.1 putative CREB-binding protein [Procambarus clarkii virus]AAL89024.1 WSSV156 [Shrimp white spot syndrome virus]AFX59477.1 wsv100 [White spot syndrome virus]AIX03665.1 wsv100 [Shrimp white spot syndrome virus]ALN66156.1 putative CREB-binding protein, immediate-early protein [White spot syndrome virus]
MSSTTSPSSLWDDDDDDDEEDEKDVKQEVSNRPPIFSYMETVSFSDNDEDDNKGEEECFGSNFDMFGDSDNMPSTSTAPFPPPSTTTPLPTPRSIMDTDSDECDEEGAAAASAPSIAASSSIPVGISEAELKKMEKKKRKEIKKLKKMMKDPLPHLYVGGEPPVAADYKTRANISLYKVDPSIDMCGVAPPQFCAELPTPSIDVYTSSYVFPPPTPAMHNKKGFKKCQFLKGRKALRKWIHENVCMAPPGKRGGVFLAHLEQRFLAEHGDEYKVPRMFVSRVLNKAFPNLIARADTLCSDMTFYTNLCWIVNGVVVCFDKDDGGIHGDASEYATGENFDTVVFHKREEQKTNGSASKKRRLTPDTSNMGTSTDVQEFQTMGTNTDMQEFQSMGTNTNPIETSSVGVNTNPLPNPPPRLVITPLTNDVPELDMMWLYSPSRGGGNSRMSANTGTSPLSNTPIPTCFTGGANVVVPNGFVPPTFPLECDEDDPSIPNSYNYEEDKVFHPFYEYMAKYLSPLVPSYNKGQTCNVVQEWFKGSFSLAKRRGTVPKFCSNISHAFFCNMDVCTAMCKWAKTVIRHGQYCNRCIVRRSCTSMLAYHYIVCRDASCDVPKCRERVRNDMDD